MGHLPGQLKVFNMRLANKLTAGIAIAIAASTLSVAHAENVSEEIRSISERSTLVRAQIAEINLQAELEEARKKLRESREDSRPTPAPSPSTAQPARSSATAPVPVAQMNQAGGRIQGFPAPTRPPVLVSIRGSGDSLVAVFSINGQQVAAKRGETLMNGYTVERVNANSVVIREAEKDPITLRVN